MANTTHANLEELKAGLDLIRQSPKDSGELQLIVRRPGVDEREILEEATLNPQTGLVGDSWISRGSSRTPDGSSHPDMQLTLMNARVISLLAGSVERWPLAGDQLYVDLDLSTANLPPGTQLAVGEAIIEVTSQPHTACQKFAERFGRDAMRFVNAPIRRELKLRGVNARVLQAGQIWKGDIIKKTLGT